MKKSGGPAPSRRETRARKVSHRLATVDESTRQQAAASRLEKLENDAPEDPVAELLDEDDEEFMAPPGSDDDDDEVGERRKGRKRKSGAKRKTRGALADGRGPTTFQRLLEESSLLDAPPGDVNYLTAAAGPSAAFAPRKFCSVCGFASTYTCARCGQTYCSRKCFTVHTETKCMKLIA